MADPSKSPGPVHVDESVASVRGILHLYGSTHALDGLDIEVPSGCMVGLIGPDDRLMSGGMVELDTGNARYLVRFNQTIERQAGWSWGLFSAVRKLSGTMSMVRTPSVATV